MSVFSKYQLLWFCNLVGVGIPHQNTMPNNGSKGDKFFSVDCLKWACGEWHRRGSGDGDGVAGPAPCEETTRSDLPAFHSSIGEIGDLVFSLLKLSCCCLALLGY